MNYSLTKRLLGLASFVLLFGFSLTGWILNSAYQAGLQASIEDKLQVQILTLLSVAEPQQNRLLLPRDLPDPRFNQLSSGLMALVIDGKGQEVWRSASALAVTDLTLAPIKAGQKQFISLSITPQDAFFVAGLGTIWEGTQGDISFSFYVLENSASFLESSEGFRATLWQLLISVALALLLLQWWLLHWGLRPLRVVATELKAIENGTKNQLTFAYPTELTHLTTSINHLIDSEQQQRQRYKDRMADLAHSLKTPLAILTSLSSTEPSTVPSELEVQVKRMANIVDYQLQRAVLGHQPLSFKKIKIAAVIQQIMAALDKVYRDKQVSCELRLDPQLSFRGDESDLTELIANLMDNAYKYGAGVVRVSLSKQDNLIALTIEDNGVGMSQAAFQQVLTRGARLDSQQSGQGIGMTVVHELVKQYHGSINIFESELLGLGINIMLP